MRFFCFASLCLCAAFASGEEPLPPEDTPLSVLQAYIAGTQAVRSYDIMATVQNSTILEPERMPVGGPLDPVQPPKWHKRTTAYNSERVSRQRFLDGMFRIDIKRIDDQVFNDDSFLSAWDGSISKKLNLQDMLGSVRGFARTQNGPALLSYQDLFLVFDGDYTFAEFMRDRELSCKLVDSYYVLTAHPSSEPDIRASRLGLELYLDPAKSFMPIRGAYLINGEKWPQCEWVNELFEPEPGVWVPKSATVSVILRDEESPFAGSPIGTKTLTLDTEQSHFNLDIAPSVFSISFPPGLTVRDDVRKVEYVSGPNGTSNHLLSLVEPARRVMRESIQDAEGKGFYRTLLVIVNAIILALVVVYVLWTRVRKAT